MKPTRRSNLIMENKSVFLSNTGHKQDSNLLLITLLLLLLLLLKELDKNLLFYDTEASSVAYLTILL
jgi:hypothetical protein